ncbi:hypothetical protein BDY24DRAFT_81451 [Mrakia frigida]|uniref:uncharacterized protein n=1 Tax=Mrakia frigida TaxID=29902 RepID=UPI003FCC0388
MSPELSSRRRARLTWDVLLLVFQLSDVPTLALLGRVSLDFLTATSPLLYRDVEISSLKQLRTLFCEKKEITVSFDFSSLSLPLLLPLDSIASLPSRPPPNHLESTPTSPLLNSKALSSTSPQIPPSSSSTTTALLSPSTSADSLRPLLSQSTAFNSATARRNAKSSSPSSCLLSFLISTQLDARTRTRCPSG